MAQIQRLVILGCCLLASAVQSDEQEQRTRLDQLKEQISSLKATLFERSSEIESLEKQLEERERGAATLRQKTQTLEQQISDLQSELRRMEQRKLELEQYSLDQQRMIAKEMNAAYRLGQSEPVQVLLNQEDPYKLARILKYYEYFAKARQEKIHQFEKTIAELDAISIDIVSKQDDLQQATEENAVKLAELNLELGKRQQIITDLGKALGDDQTRLTKLNEEQSQLQELIARLEEEIHDLAPPSSEPFAKLRGKLPWPTSGKLTQGYGSTRSQTLKWSGWLIDTEVGTPVVAVHNGRIVYSDYFRGHGLMVIIDHGDGFLSLYAHNQLLVKEVGDWVKAGDAIAQAGSTGGLIKSALYFEIRHNGKPQDPKRWLKSQG